MKRHLSTVYLAGACIAAYSFSPKCSMPITVTAPDTEDEEIVLHETFDKCSGTGGNDGRWSGNIASSTFSPDIDGWSSYKCYGGNHCARFGTGICSIEAPAFYLNGSATAIFRVAPWATSKDKSIDIYFNGEMLGVYELEAEKWTDITLSVQATGTNQFEIISGGRLFIDDLKISSTTASSIRDIHRNTADGPIYSIDGKFIGKNKADLPKGVYIINHKKVIISR